jgi:hypothetical protein
MLSRNAFELWALHMIGALDTILSRLAEIAKSE